MLLALPLLAALSPASAEEPAPADTTTAAPVAAPAGDETARKRKFLMEVGFRGRYMDLPDSLLDLWYFRNADTNDAIPDRPHVSAYSLGIEFVIKDDKANGIFYVEYLNPLIDAGYWDDKEEPPDHLDGSWIEPDKFGLVLIGASYAYELRATNWLSFLFGAGIGGAIKIGELNEWQPGEDPANPEGNNNNTQVDCGEAGEDDSAAYFRKDNCASDGAIETPPAIPYLDVTIGPRFNIADRASIRLEGGIHAFLPYGGASVGIVF
ncbi:MAG: hypothetical protein ACK4YP_11835 [Myxococcota bacterium]